MSRRRAHAQFEAEAESVHNAREFVAATLHGWEVDDMSEAAVLLTSELVTNAIIHAVSAYRVALELEDGHIRVEVEDASSRFPARRAPDDGATGGRGLVLVEALATEWGARTVRGGKLVWFDLAAPVGSAAAEPELV